MGLSYGRISGVLCAAACSLLLLTQPQLVHARPAAASAEKAGTPEAGKRAAGRGQVANAVAAKVAVAKERTKAAISTVSEARRQRRAATQMAASQRGGRHGMRVVRASFAPILAPLSVGQAIGLKSTEDPLDLRSSVALVVDQETGETLFDKNAQAVLPIASITKLMTALVVVEAKLPGDEMIEITEAEIDTEKNTRSRLAVGTRLSRAEMLQLALMASENRASHALGRTYPGGVAAFVAAMNAKARALGMNGTTYSDPTGLSSQNQSNARDLVKLMRAAYEYPVIRDFSVASDLTVDTGYRVATFRNTNRLTRESTWDIGMQKTGFINEAGNCLVMQARVEGRGLWIVLLDAQGSTARVSDANRLRRWIGDESRKVSDETLRVRTAT